MRTPQDTSKHRETVIVIAGSIALEAAALGVPMLLTRVVFA